jgi:hypothetical protein
VARDAACPTAHSAQGARPDEGLRPAQRAECDRQRRDPDAETPDAHTPDETTLVATPDGAIAGAGSGLGSTEVARRRLTDSQIRALLRAEVDERLRAAEHLADNGAEDRAAAVRSEADVLTAVLAEGSAPGQRSATS